MRIERQIAFWVVALLVFVGLLWLLHHILLPFVVGAALAYLLDPLANKFTKHGISRLIAALLILGGFVLVVVGLFVVIAPVLATQFSGFVPTSGICATPANTGRRSEPSVAECHLRQRSRQ